LGCHLFPCRNCPYLYPMQTFDFAVDFFPLFGRKSSREHAQVLCFVIVKFTPYLTFMNPCIVI